MIDYPTFQDDERTAANIHRRIEQSQQRDAARQARVEQRRTNQEGRPQPERMPAAAAEARAPLAERSVLPPALLRLGPHVIGGSPGSGTRVIARIAQRGGMYIGSDLNESADELSFRRFANPWFDRALLAQARGEDTEPHPRMVRDFEAFLLRHCAPVVQAPVPWGWKAPRTLLLLPFLDQQVPALSFVHLVRDGRYMAFSQQQFILRHHGHVLLEPAEEEWSQPAQSIALWRRTNLAAADYGEQRMGGRYLRVRFEELCADPVPVVQRLLDFFGLTGDAAAIVEQEVQAPPPRTWEGEDRALVAELEAIAGDALHRFGYQEDQGASRVAERATQAT
jgi:hypothetical protein